MMEAFLTLFMIPAVLADQSVDPGGINDMNVQKYMILSWIAVFTVLLLYRWSIALMKQIRLIVCMGDENKGRHHYFSVPVTTFASLKRHIFIAPLFRKRHNREYTISSAINMGTLPSRLHFFLLVSYFAANAAFCAITIDWSNKATFYSSAVHRTGVVLVTNICILFLFAGRNNPLIYLLGVSFDTYNLLHRWIGRIIVFEAIAHTAFWFMGKYATKDSKSATAMIKAALTTSPLIISGTLAISAFIVLLLHSPGALRHAFYETFLHVHIVVAIIATAALWMHLKDLKSQGVLFIAIVFWAAERFLRFTKLFRRNVSASLSKAEFEALPGEAIRVTLHVSKPWRFHPGQHIYLYVPAIGLWTSHPFSVVWSSEQDGYTREKRLPLSEIDPLGRQKTTMSLIIRRRTGFTDALYRKAEVAPAGKIMTTALVEGPYGRQCFRSYGTVALFAAGVGITHQVPHVRDLVQAYARGTCATRRVLLVWVLQSPEHLEWIRPWMTQILAMSGRRDVLRIMLFISRPRSTKEVHSPSASVQMFPGKPDVGALLQKEQDHQIGALAVSVCGTGSMADDVRKAVRDRQHKTEIDFFEEAFSW